MSDCTPKDSSGNPVRMFDVPLPNARIMIPEPVSVPITRDEVAMRVFVEYAPASGYSIPQDAVNAFDAADAFMAELEKRRTR